MQYTDIESWIRIPQSKIHQHYRQMPRQSLKEALHYRIVLALLRGLLGQFLGLIGTSEFYITATEECML